MLSIFSKAKRIRNKRVFERNRADVIARNAVFMRIMLMAMLAIFCVSLAYSFVFSDLAYMKAVYIAAIALCAGMLALLWAPAVRGSLSYLYVVYAIGIAYCALTSALASPGYICVTILAVQFLFPTLFVDRDLRLNTAAILFGVIYLVVAVPNKTAALRTDEIVNVTAFTLIGVIIGSFVRHVQLDNINMKRKLERQADTDALTRLPNRRSFFKLLTQAEKPDCSNPILGFAMIDIDDFKQYNDTFGHQAGDEYLREIGECMRALQARHDVRFFRYGGEEFVAVNRAYAWSDFVALCEELRQSVTRLTLRHAQDSAFCPSVSIGAARQEDVTSRRLESLLTNADLALYAAKAGGKNRVVCFSADLANLPLAQTRAPSFRQR